MKKPDKLTLEIFRTVWGGFRTDLMNTFVGIYSHASYLKSKSDEHALTKELVDRSFELQQKYFENARNLLDRITTLLNQSEKKRGTKGSVPVFNENLSSNRSETPPATLLFLKLVGELSDRHFYHDRLMDLVKHEKDYKTRQTALSLIDSEPLIREIALTSDNGLIRQSAVRRLDDQELLKKIALTDSDSGVKMAVVDKVTDRDFIVRMAKNDPDGCVRVCALKKLGDTALIEACIKNDPLEFVRQQAGELLQTLKYQTSP